LGNEGYVGAGYDGTSYYNNFFKFNAQTNTWSVAPSILEHNMFTYPSIFVIGDTAYLGNGRNTQLQYMTEFIKLVSPFTNSIDETPKSTVNIYPNPTSTFINIDFDDPEDISKITLSDVLGNVISEISADIKTSNSLNIDKLSNGTYFCIVLFKSNKTHSKKLVLIH
jgi:hypothetical protein